ncbi:soluble quino protein glucose dehydrogenase [Cutaneotrichosporon oleaginosum]|uniref:Soluble quino protein glucose dehydrogenase n=1 Tax=Cutaneotrichosporon oleaginosum TaxID=879819 RepID=A0A0J0XEP3_9TREE|nr:soluble quino protein glucose dehydrogenase [Cutaneotrichosporon oleaginosum]KLT39518.1 soluble quino protein glucose dehydrogenase [Cutaneotrichosporon oleaginosum]TXT07083.1 hypothetical protein COLE_06414 [Cutaneotrichosporon oleaginosum]
MRDRPPAFVFALLVAATLSAAKCSNDIQPAYDHPVPAAGWSWRLIANGLTKPRSITFDSAGALLVLDEGAGINRLVLQDDGGTCLRVKEKTVVVADTALGHGLALADDGTLYASTDNDVWSWAYNSGAGTVDTSSKRTVVTNMTNSGHTSRTLMLSRASPGWLVVSRGSEGNDDPLAQVEASGHSQIRAFDVGEARDTPYNFPSDGRQLGWGLRNSVGIAEHPVTGGVWSVENSVDNLQRAGIDIHVDNPGEELNYHGSIANIEGGNYGYPVCYALWSTDAPFPSLGDLTTGSQFAPDRRGNQTSSNDTTCNSEYKAPELTFQAHTAPLDIEFDKNGSNAFVSFHGSWNRPEKVGYSVNVIAWDPVSGRPRAARDSKDAAVPVLSNKDLTKCPRGCFRPVGLAWGSQERLFVASDTTGEIYVLANDGGKDSGGALLMPSMTVLAAALVLGLVL